MADTLIYSHLTFRSQNMNNGLSRLEERLQEMDQNPHCWTHFHSLSLNMQSSSEWSYCISLITEATRKSSVVCQLALSTQIPSFNQEPLEIIAKYPLKPLSLSSVRYGIGFRTIWKGFNFPTLQYILLCQVVWSDEFMNLLKHIAFYQSWTYVSEECAIEYQQLNQPDKFEQLPPVGFHQNYGRMKEKKEDSLMNTN